jgi:hypothetical protein
MMQYKIKAAAFRIPLVRISQDVKEKLAFSSREYLQGWRKPIYIPYLADSGVNMPWVAHNFWLLVGETEGQEEELEAAHGFASQITTNKEGKTVIRAMPVGQVNDLLMVHFLKKLPQQVLDGDHKGHWLIADPEDQKVIYGNQEPTQDVLKRWQRLKTARTILNSYKVPYSAFGLGWTLGFGSLTVNSNSAYRTMGMIMELPIHHFNHWQPGIENTMIPEKDLADLIQVIKEQEVKGG